MTNREAKFGVGQLVRHQLFGYRGVIFDVDAEFNGSEDWYATMARSGPPKDRPWYHVLVHDHSHTTYVAERNLAPDDSCLPIVHPALDRLFASFRDGRYVRSRAMN